MAFAETEFSNEIPPVGATSPIFSPKSLKTSDLAGEESKLFDQSMEG